MLRKRLAHSWNYITGLPNSLLTNMILCWTYRQLQPVLIALFNPLWWLFSVFDGPFANVVQGLADYTLRWKTAILTVRYWLKIWFIRSGNRHIFRSWLTSSPVKCVTNGLLVYGRFTLLKPAIFSFPIKYVRYLANFCVRICDFFYQHQWPLQ